VLRWEAVPNPFPTGTELVTVWFRRSGLPMRPPGMSDADWAVASRECDYHIRNVRRLIAPDAFWVNDIAAREVVLLKMPQLIAAAQCGFAIPETLYSNDPDEIRCFWGEHRKAGVIFKLHLQTHWHAQSSGERHALFTTEQRQENLQDDAPLAGCPAIYQRKVDLRTARHLHGRALRGHPSRLAVARFDAARLAIGYGGAAQAGACRIATHGRGAVYRAHAQARTCLRLHRSHRYARGGTHLPRGQRDGAVSVGGTGRAKIRAAPLLCDGTAQSAAWAVDSARRG
jgi:hypothetical protein